MSQAVFVTPETSIRREQKHHASSTDWPIYQYFGIYNDESDGPQAFHTMREPNCESRAHFHHVDQFQVMFGAPDTTFQRHLTGPLLVHYSDADTLYGPFSSGDQPFSFMTLRPNGNSFKGYMPEDKDAMSHGEAKRHYGLDMGRWFEEEIPTQGDAIVESELDEHEDRLAVLKATVPPGTKVTVPLSAGSGGQYVVVVQGEFLHDEATYPKFTMGWVAPEDEAPVLVAGDSGGKLLVLEFGVGNVK